MRALRWLDEHLEALILIVLSILTVIVIFLQVFMRYVMGSSLLWAEELARYAFIWMVYIGLSYGIKKDRHLKVDAFALLFNEKGKLVLKILSNLAFLAFSLILAYYTYQIVGKISRLSPAMNIPMQWVYAAPMIGLLLTSIRIIQKIRSDIIIFKSIKKGR